MGEQHLSLQDVEVARQRLAGVIYLSPCAYSETISQLAGARTSFKLENLQMTGSFKERGAANRLLTLSEAERARGVVAASAGNHGLAVAFHARRLGIRATIVMPEWAPLIKVTSARRDGAEVILAGDDYDEANEAAQKLWRERQATFVHPFDDYEVIAGQGTIGLELLDQEPDLEAAIIPVGGGGLIGGVGDGAMRDRNAESPQQALGLVFEDLHRPALYSPDLQSQKPTGEAPMPMAWRFRP